jgi:hypothetical protein
MVVSPVVGKVVFSGGQVIFLPNIAEFATFGVAHGRFGGTDNLHVAQALAGKIGTGVGVNQLTR